MNWPCERTIRPTSSLNLLRQQTMPSQARLGLNSHRLGIVLGGDQSPIAQIAGEMGMDEEALAYMRQLVSFQSPRSLQGNTQSPRHFRKTADVFVISPYQMVERRLRSE